MSIFTVYFIEYKNHFIDFNNETWFTFAVCFIEYKYQYADINNEDQFSLQVCYNDCSCVCIN